MGGGGRQRRPGSSRHLPLRELWERQRRHCWLCGKMVRFEDATRDHLVNWADGGGHGYDNVRLAHRWCNQERGLVDDWLRRRGEEWRTRTPAHQSALSSPPLEEALPPWQRRLLELQAVMDGEEGREEEMTTGDAGLEAPS